ncbi:PRC-barrel domain-containing protein [Desertibaculum subflavum]|uniref:PRC-barrel domain-containing protein n=1 Tax=Desertibaculum subflavum TaxID=2268458 RepID=UPI000E6603BA
MTERLLSGAVFALALALPTTLSAQTATVPPAQQPPGVTTVQPGSPVATTGPFLGLEGMPIRAESGEKVGEVEDVLIDPQGRVVALAIEIDRVLGIGDYDRVATLDLFRHAHGKLYTSLTREQLEALPEWRD